MLIIKLLNMLAFKTARRLQYISQLLLGSSEQNPLASHSGSNTNHINVIYVQNAEFLNP